MEIRKLDDIIIKDELYPRDKINQSKVKEYSECISLLPPIEINQDNIIIDGVHRYWAHKETGQKEIKIEITETKDDDDLFLKAIEANSKHGLILDNKTKKKLVVRLYSKLLNEKVDYDVDKLKQVFSIPDSTFSLWTKNLNDEVEAQRLEKILDLYLQCKTQQEIADEIGIKQNTVSDKIKQIEQFLNDLSKNSELEIPIIYNEIAKKWQKISGFNPIRYNIFGYRDSEGHYHYTPSPISNEYKHFGNIPIEFINNLLYYYTEPFDIVYDPFAGGGLTIDACRKWFRKYYVSDRKPIELRKKEIKKWDIKDGLPKDLPSPKLIFLDPPYWKQAEGQYSSDKEDLANMSLEDFYASLKIFIKQLKSRMKPNSYVALIIQNTQWKNDLKLEDHQYEIQKIFRDVGFEFEQRIICPYSTEQYNAQQVEKAKKKKICMQIYRDLLVFKKEK